ncbi:substrate-binding periplasmic protein [Thalassotalea sediminis]|uniref:substrate-binding periplasmic protein n=1 Tax=Thalassotalea sediminis TaxID=1759089 RepID=UPI00257457AC|nr:ABC transporter substrate-binding protein [Thalassotalea sediminis]
MFRRVIFNCLLVVLSHISVSTGANEITFVTEDLPPLQINNHNATHSGAMVELINELIKELNIKANIVFMPWARAFNIAQNTENVFVFSMLRSADRESLFQWVGKIYTIRAHLASLANKHITLNSIEDAKAYKIGVTRNALAESYLKKRGFIENKNVYASPTYNALWSNLLNGNTDMTFTNNIIWAPQVTKAGVDPKSISLIYEITDFASEMYLAASKTTDTALVKKAAIALEKIKADGRYDKILKKWQL